MPAQSTVMSNQDFLSRVDGIKHEIRQLTTNIGEIGSIHQRLLNSTGSDTASSAQLNNLVSQTQVLNTRIKDQIKQLETDSAKDRNNQTKSSQIRTLKSNFKSQLEDYQREEQEYRKRYREQIARQYRIVNPEASDMEVREAADANWGDEGVFQTAVSLSINMTNAHTLIHRSSNPTALVLQQASSARSAHGTTTFNKSSAHSQSSMSFSRNWPSKSFCKKHQYKSLRVRQTRC